MGTMHELEVKILEVDVTGVVKKLISLGARRTFEGDIVASYFNFPVKSPYKPLPSPVRLRKKGDTVELCYKRPTQTKGAKAMMEYETHVEDFDETRDLLLAMGMVELQEKRIAKHRVSYALDDALYEFDTIPRIPTFLEIEARSMTALRRAVTTIGYTMKDTKTWSGGDVIKHYRGTRR